MKEQKVTQTVSRVGGSATAQERYTYSKAVVIANNWCSLGTLMTVQLDFVPFQKKSNHILLMNFAIAVGSVLL